MEQMNKKEILDILDNAKNERGAVPMRLVRQAFDKLPTIQPVATDTNAGDTISRQAVIDAIFSEPLYKSGMKKRDVDVVVPAIYEKIKSLPSVQPEKQRGRTFREIVVEYPSYNTYPEYKGKPYFSIKYTENGQEFIGYGTYKPEVLSEYLKEYFMPSAQLEKEIPKRVLWNGWKGVRDTRYKCPNCKKPVRNTDIYCHRCGQKLMFPNIDFTPYVEGQKQELIVRWDDE